jgi:hypothetical protein
METTAHRRFARVVERQGWILETVWDGGSETFPDCEAALTAAKQLSPDWIEIGEITPATAASPQHHRWRTLRKQPDGTYAESGLRWQSGGTGRL